MQWKQLIVERDGQTPCFARLGGAVGALLLVGLEAWGVAKGQTVDPVQFATAWTLLVAGTAGAARLKLATEAPEAS